jgi:hypothetical protein
MKKALTLFLIGSIVISISSYIQSTNPYFAGFDAYTHVKIAELFLKKGILHKFPWLYYTPFREHFVDDHFLFHIFLMPFVFLFGKFLGAKFAIIIIQVFLFITFYLFLSKNKILYPFFWTISLFALPAPFIWRLNLIRPLGLFLLFLMLFLYFLFSKNIKFLFLISFLTALLAQTASLYIIIILLVYSLIYYLQKKKFLLKLLIFGIIGLLTGLIINPYFPYNLKFVYNFLKLSYVFQLSHATELFSYSMLEYVKLSFFPLSILTFSIVIIFIYNYKQSPESITLFVISIFFLILLSRHQRFIEMWAPFTFLSGIFLLNPFLKNINSPPQIKRKDNIKNKYNNLLLLSIFLILPCQLLYNNIILIKQWTKPAFDIPQTKEAITFIKNNSHKGDIIFIQNWSIFPYYFFFNDKNYYPFGMDPLFMYLYSPELYKKFLFITSQSNSIWVAGEKIQNSKYKNVTQIKSDFNAKWVILNFRYQTLEKELTKRKDIFKKVFNNKNYTIFKIK